MNVTGYYISVGGRTSIDYGLTLENAVYGDIEVRTSFVKLPYRNGALNASKLGGKVYIERVPLTYSFVCSADTPQELNEKLGMARLWFAGISGGELVDSFQGTAWKYTDVQLMRSSVNYLGMHCTSAQLTVELTADPYMTNVYDPSIRRL